MTRRKKTSRLDPTLSRGIIAVLLAVFAAIIILSFFDRAGFVGTMLDEYILSFLFGSIRYFTPAIILILAWFLLKDIDYDYRPTHGIGALLFFLSLSSVMHLGFETRDMWRQALEGHGGGIFGMLAWPMKEYLGVVASYVILIGIVIISIFLIFNTTLAAFVLIHKKFFAALGWFGRSLVSIIKKLFLPTGNHVKIKGDYNKDTRDEENDEEIYENDEVDEDTSEEPVEERFAKKHLRSSEEDDGEDTEGGEEEPEKQKASDVWSKRVIIKNLPPLTLLSDKRGKPTSGDIVANAEIIQDTFSQFGIGVAMGEIRVGPTVTQYSLKPDKGIKLSRITGLSNDLALALAAHPIRIEAPIPGKPLVGIEVPNERAALVSVKELLESKEFRNRQHSMMIALGKDVAGKVWFGDLPRMPHLLIAGATGSGKTVCVNTIIMSLLFQNTAEILRLIMVDPKRVELTLYNGIPHLLTPVITNVQKTVNALKWTIGEMDRRFELLASVGSRDISSYNTKYPDHKIPHIVFIIDELADLMASAANEVEAGIIRLAQMARAVGIHLILATQRPSVDVITGLMKANIPARIAFSVASQIDSRTILDSPGAEKLLGRGDMLFQTAELSKPIRIQGAFISEEELKDVVDYLKGDEEPEYDESIVEHHKGGGTANMFGGTSDDQDPLFEEAQEAMVKAGKASASFLQRRLKIGYARAARILDELEEAGIIGPAQGAKPREILVTEVEVRDTMDAGGELNTFDEPENVDEENSVEEDTNEEQENEEGLDNEEGKNSSSGTSIF
ncbi:MAG TPA: cell division protein FtsK [Candidatus Magasanikbacteria bacterium]|nr:cell division protein FtsK [Candidatus Magasanikbacteria bacterium]